MDTDVKSTEENMNTQEIAGASQGQDATQDTIAQVTQVASQAWDRFAQVPDYFIEIFREYKSQLTLVGLILGALIAVKLTFALLGAINDIPVLAPLFELIGMIWTVWFGLRYLYKAESRQELMSNLNSVKDQVLGRNS